MKRPLLLVVLAFVLPACGSTVQVRGQANWNGVPGSGLGGSAAAGSGSGAAVSPGIGGAGQFGGISGTNPSPTFAIPLPGGSAGPNGQPSGPSRLPTTGRGYDAANIYIGFPTNNDASGASHSLGISGLDFGDQIGQVNAVVSEINKRGGLLGRHVVAVIHDMKTADLEANAPSQAQATCDAFTQDRPVVAVVNIVAAIDIDTFFACLAKRQTPLFSGGFVPADGTLLRTYSPYLYKLPAPDFDRFGPVWLARLAALGYFTGWDTSNGAPGGAPTKVGLLYADAQPSKRIFAKLKSELTSRGISVAGDIAYDASSVSNESAAMSNAVLTFRGSGVTHVLSDASDVQLFMTAADSQHYKPRYGMNSYLAPQLQAGNTPGQLVGSVGIGWIPAADVASAESPGPNPGEATCRQIMQAGGQAMSSYGVELVAFSLCDGVRLFVSAATAAGRMDATALQSAFSQVGPSFASALTFRSGITAQSKSLPGVGRDFAWQTSCSCYRYLNTINRIW